MNTSRPFKTVYISHPFRGDMGRDNINIKTLVGNMEKVDRICLKITADYPDVLPLSPLNAFSFLALLTLADNQIDEKALEMDMKLLELADELWVFGEWEKSEGCRMEIERARELCIPIIYESGKTELPKSFCCLEAPYKRPVVSAWDVAQAARLLGCTDQCRVMCGCGGPSEYIPSDEENGDEE